MGELSAASGVAVLGVGYRLAPEHRQPEALQDVLQVLAWLHGQGLSGPRVALAGDSAGGGLALSALMALAARGAPRPAAACLMSAWTDMTASGSSYESRAQADPIHQRKMIQALARGCLAPGQDAADPRASPLLAPAAQLATLPPLLLQVGDRETLLSDSVDLAARVCGAGGQAQCQVWPGMVHVFQQFPRELQAARQALAEAGAFLARHLA
jgi:acetyl esterase/lipase